MKKLLNLAIVILICSIVLCACSNKNELVGVYMAKTASTPNEAIILYKDGTCSYFGDSDTAWEANADSVTITKREPDQYFIDVYLDSDLSSLEMRSIATKCNTVENVYSSMFLESESMIRVEIINKNDAEQTEKELSGIKGVTKAEFFVQKGAVHKYQFNVVDNCLVSSSGSVYIKQGN